MVKRIVDETSGSVRHLVRPEHIDIREHLFGAFGNVETEISAKWIVRLCQASGIWKAFTLFEVETLYCVNGYFDRFSFNQLLDGENGFVVLGEDGKYRVTHEFIYKCFGSSPDEKVFGYLRPGKRQRGIIAYVDSLGYFIRPDDDLFAVVDFPDVPDHHSLPSGFIGGELIYFVLAEDRQRAQKYWKI